MVFIALGVVLFTVLFLIGGTQLYFQNSMYSVNAEKATALAEAGIDKALASLNETGGSYNGESETVLGDGSYSVTITNKDSATKIIEALGYIPNKLNAKVKRKITIQVSKGVGVSFVYGLQVGGGGLAVGNGSTLNGSVYSNGSVVGGNNAQFSGDIWVAQEAMTLPDQESDCISSNCQDYIFGRSMEGELRRGVAQSFQPSSNGILNKVSLKLKKNGLPANPTVRIMADSGGQPNKNAVLATGILSAGSVSQVFGFADVTFDNSANLEGGDTYWIMVQPASDDMSNYWVWSLDLAQGYSRGSAKWSPDWQAGNPSWNSISGDLGFKIYMGAPTSIELGNGSSAAGNVHANTILGTFNIGGDAYYKTIAPSVIVSGTKHDNSADPQPAVFPISESNIAVWKEEAQNQGTRGSISSCVGTLGPGKIDGDVILGNSCFVTVSTPVWITGILTAGNGTKFTLDENFGPASGIIIVDGKVSLGNGNDFLGSGAEGSYLMLLALNPDDSIDVGNSSISGILYAPNGKVTLSNGASFNEITAWRIEMGNNATLNYQSGMAQAFFSSGPSGSFSLVKGTYRIN